MLGLLDIDLGETEIDDGLYWLFLFIEVVVELYVGVTLYDDEVLL